jgi:uncharacterized protein (TIGR02246 family)
MRTLLLLLTLAAVGSVASFAATGGRHVSRPKPQTVGGAAQKASGADEQAIRASAEAFTKAFNAGDAKAVAALWTPDGEYVDEDGTVYTSRPVIEKEYAAFFKEHPKARMQIDIASIRLVQPDLAIEEGSTRLIEPPVGATSEANYVVVHKKQDGKWQMASVHDLDSTPLSNYAVLKPLELVIGDWSAKNDQGHVESHFEWMQNRNFIRRSFDVYHGDEKVASGLQIIGVDPGTGEVVSWEFDGDGGFGRGLWTQDGSNWRIEAEGITKEGLPTTATNLVKFADKNTFTWQSTNRTLGDQPVADVPETRISRKK